MFCISNPEVGLLLMLSEFIYFSFLVVCTPCWAWSYQMFALHEDFTKELDALCSGMLVQFGLCDQSVSLMHNVVPPMKCPVRKEDLYILSVSKL